MDMSGLAQDAAALDSSVAMAAAGDTIAFARLVDAYYAETMRVAFVVAGGDREVAEDAVQSAWSIAWQKLGSLRDPARLRPWLFAVTANEARQIARRRHRHPMVEIDVAACDPTGPDSSSLVRAIDLQRALAHLAPEDRSLLALRYVAGLDSSEIAALTKRPASSVRGRLAALLARLRKELSDD
jgi:RNA polymerase sigma-70 factor (ECF subfamily)